MELALPELEKVVILIPTHKPILDYSEIISLRQCFNVLGNYPIKIICPAGLNVERYKKIAPHATFDFLEPTWFSSIKMYNLLRIGPLLYEKYSNFEFILFYELDAFVFSDELAYWCSKGFDNIGAPWFEGFIREDSTNPIGAGNGGFCLRNVKKCLDLSKRVSEIKEPVEVFWPGEYCPDDIFWSLYVTRHFPDFNNAPISDALKFSFERKPELLFELNNKRLPFGCHKWQKNAHFWKDFIHKYFSNGSFWSPGK
jgi:hypothetical protein